MSRTPYLDNVKAAQSQFNDAYDTYLARAAARDDAVVEARHAGHKIEQIAAAGNVTRQTIHRILRNALELDKDDPGDD